jgi:hypothetical protein
VKRNPNVNITSENTPTIVPVTKPPLSPIETGTKTVMLPTSPTHHAVTIL